MTAPTTITAIKYGSSFKRSNCRCQNAESPSLFSQSTAHPERFPSASYHRAPWSSYLFTALRVVGEMTYREALVTEYLTVWWPSLRFSFDRCSSRSHAEGPAAASNVIAKVTRGLLQAGAKPRVRRLIHTHKLLVAIVVVSYIIRPIAYSCTAGSRYQQRLSFMIKGMNSHRRKRPRTPYQYCLIRPKGPLRPLLHFGELS
jgi:hypothetical protein